LATQWQKENQAVPLQIINLAEDGRPYPKKRALTRGIELSKSDWIFTLDADYILYYFAYLAEEMLSFVSVTEGRSTVMIAGPLKIDFRE
jgi:hypothetical protein